MIDESYIEKILSDTSEGNKENVIGFVKYFKTYPLNENNFTVFQKIIDTNINEALEILFKDRNPETFFSTLKPNRKLIFNALNTLIKYSPKKISILGVSSSLGILQNVYKNARNGLKIYMLSASDIQHIAKYLLIDNDEIDKIIVEFLEAIWEIGVKDISVLSKNILNSYYDNKKNLTDFIPENLLI